MERTTHRRRRRQRRTGWWFVSAVIAVAGLIYWADALKIRKLGKEAPLASAVARNGKTAARHAAERQGRPVYRHSVIPGGAYSTAELRETERRDPVVAAHYAVFNHGALRMTQADESRPVFVSYRVGEKIYWSRKPVRLARSEPLITDGVREARARCGNRISETPRQPTAPGAAEPPLEDLDTADSVALDYPPEAAMPAPEYTPLLALEIFPPIDLTSQAPLTPLVPTQPAGGSSSGGGYSPYPGLGGGGSAGGVSPWGNPPRTNPETPVVPPSEPQGTIVVVPAPGAWAPPTPPAETPPLSVITSPQPLPGPDGPIILPPPFIPMNPPLPPAGPRIVVNPQVPSGDITPPSGGGGQTGGTPETPGSPDTPAQPTPPPDQPQPDSPDSPQETPEPGSFLLLGGGVTAILALRRHARR
jgi:hypothetical protein